MRKEVTVSSAAPAPFPAAPAGAAEGWQQARPSFPIRPPGRPTASHPAARPTPVGRPLATPLSIDTWIGTRSRPVQPPPQCPPILPPRPSPPRLPFVHPVDPSQSRLYPPHQRIDARGRSRSTRNHNRGRDCGARADRFKGARREAPRKQPAGRRRENKKKKHKHKQAKRKTHTHTQKADRGAAASGGLDCHFPDRAGSTRHPNQIETNQAHPPHREATFCGLRYHGIEPWAAERFRASVFAHTHE